MCTQRFRTAALAGAFALGTVLALGAGSAQAAEPSPLGLVKADSTTSSCQNNFTPNQQDGLLGLFTSPGTSTNACTPAAVVS